MIALDTHVLVWYISNPERLSKKARRKIESEIKRGNEILISSICVWEIYMLVKKGRLKLSMDIDSWLEKLEQLNFLEFIPVTNKIAAKSVNLPDTPPEDPADRIIIATALQQGATLITSDKRILNYPHVQVLW